MDVRQRIKNHQSEKAETENKVKNDKNVTVERFSLQQIILSFCGLIVTGYVLFPVLFYSSSTLRQHILFMNYVDFSPKVNFSNPEALSQQCCKNFYLPSEDNSILGVWHILPGSLKNKKCDKHILNDHSEFDDDRPVILYLHGSGGNRGARHRVYMYKILTDSSIDAHVVTLDYRGFGDSTNSYLSVDSVVTDAEVVYRWLLSQVKVNRIYVWGHSMGAAAALKLTSTRSVAYPVGLVMEAPFANSVEAVKDFPLTVLYRHMPFFEKFFADPLQSKDTYFDSTVLIRNVTFPVLILHARDDTQIPYYQGESLYRIAQQSNNSKVKFIGYDKSLGYDHLHIGKDPDLPNKILSFMALATKISD